MLDVGFRIPGKVLEGAFLRELVFDLPPEPGKSFLLFSVQCKFGDEKLAAIFLVLVNGSEVGYQIRLELVVEPLDQALRFLAPTGG